MFLSYIPILCFEHKFHNIIIVQSLASDTNNFVNQFNNVFMCKVVVQFFFILEFSKRHPRVRRHHISFTRNNHYAHFRWVQVYNTTVYIHTHTQNVKFKR